MGYDCPQRHFARIRGRLAKAEPCEAVRCSHAALSAGAVRRLERRMIRRTRRPKAPVCGDSAGIHPRLKIVMGEPISWSSDTGRRMAAHGRMGSLRGGSERDQHRSPRHQMRARAALGASLGWPTRSCARSAAGCAGRGQTSKRAAEMALVDRSAPRSTATPKCAAHPVRRASQPANSGLLCVL